MLAIACMDKHELYDWVALAGLSEEPEDHGSVQHRRKQLKHFHECQDCITFDASWYSAPVQERDNTQSQNPDAWLHGYCVPNWFRRLAVFDTSASSYDKAAVAGLCARLGAAVDNDPMGSLTAICHGCPSPALRVASWASRLSKDDIAGLEQDVLTEVTAQSAALHAVRLLAVDAQDAAGRSVLLALCEQRDDLESVLAVLRAAGHKEATDFVATLDHEVHCAASTLALLGSIKGTPRLRAVHATDPDAWWGRI